MELLDNHSLILDSIRLLASAPEDGRARIKQKTCASLVSRILTKVNSIDKEETKLLKDLCIEHSNNQLGGHIVAMNIRLDSYSPQLQEYVKKAVKNVSTEKELNDFINSLQLKLQAKDIEEALDDLVIEASKMKTLTSFSELRSSFEKLIQRHYLKITDLRQLDDPTDTMIIGPNNENMLITLEKLSQISKQRIRLKTGFNKLDNILKGGFEATRIYIFGGKPGLGKSTLLLNFMHRAAKYNKFIMSDDKPDILVYITLENDMVETSERLFSILLRKPIRLDKIESSDLELAQNHLNNLKCYLHTKYMKPYTTTSMDIYIYLDNLAQNYNIRGVFIDYLNLVRSSSGVVTEKRHELGAVTSELKVIAKQLQCPVIVPAQLNTAGYDGLPTMKNLDESRQIAQNADFVGLLFEMPEEIIPPQLVYKYPDDEYAFIAINIDKNRNGPNDLYPLLGRRSLFTFDEFTGSELTIVSNSLKQWAKRPGKYSNGNDGNNNYNKQNDDITTGQVNLNSGDTDIYDSMLEIDSQEQSMKTFPSL